VYNNVDASHRNQGVTTLKVRKSMWRKSTRKEYGHRRVGPQRRWQHIPTSHAFCGEWNHNSQEFYLSATNLINFRTSTFLSVFMLNH